MAATIVIEQESGTSTGWIHPHNGYYAGDFRNVPVRPPIPVSPKPWPVAPRSTTSPTR